MNINSQVPWVANAVPTALRLQGGAATVATATDWPYLSSSTSWPHHHDQWLMQTIICGAHHPPGARAADPSAAGLRGVFGLDPHGRNIVAVRPQPGQMGSGVLQNNVGAWRAAGIAVSESVAGRVDESVDVGAQANPAGIYPVLAIPPPQHPAHGPMSLHPALSSGFDNHRKSIGDTTRCRPALGVQQPHGVILHHLLSQVVYADRPPSATGVTTLCQPPVAAHHMSTLDRAVRTEVTGAGLANHRSTTASQLTGTPVVVAGATGLPEAPVADVVEHNSSGGGALEPVTPVDKDDAKAGGASIETDGQRPHSLPPIATNRPPSCGSNKRPYSTSNASPESACSTHLHTPTVSPGTDNAMAPAVEVGAIRHRAAENQLRVSPPTGAVSVTGIGLGVADTLGDSSSPGAKKPRAKVAVNDIVRGSSDLMIIPEGASEDPDSWLAGEVWMPSRLEHRTDVPPSPLLRALRNDGDGGHESGAAFFSTESDETLVLNNGAVIEAETKVGQLTDVSKNKVRLLFRR